MDREACSSPAAGYPDGGFAVFSSVLPYNLRTNTSDKALAFTLLSPSLKSDLEETSFLRRVELKQKFAPFNAKYKIRNYYCCNFYINRVLFIYLYKRKFSILCIWKNSKN